jgi:hypothetical protein
MCCGANVSVPFGQPCPPLTVTVPVKDLTFGGHDNVNVISPTICTTHPLLEVNVASIGKKKLLNSLLPYSEVEGRLLLMLVLVKAVLKQKTKNSPRKNRVYLFHFTRL